MAGARSGRPDLSQASCRPGRQAHLDRLRATLVAAVIGAHGVMGYAHFGSWPYQRVREVALTGRSDVVVTAVFALPAMFLMPFFFLLAGMLAPRSLAHKGTRRFVTGRLVRLGTPWVVTALVVWPTCVYYLVDRRSTGAGSSYWSGFTRARPVLDAGPLWFVLVLLLYSLLYAVVRRLVPHGTRAAVDPRALVTLTAGIVLATFAIRIPFPVDSTQPLGLQLPQWPSCLGLFLFGTLVGPYWALGVPPRVRRSAGRTALTGVAVLVMVAAASAVLPSTKSDVLGGVHWAALAMAVVEGTVSVGASVWLLGVAAAHERPLAALGRAAARASYGAFALQGPVLLVLATTLRSTAVPVEGKAALVAISGVLVSFFLSWLLVTRTVLGRVL